MLEITKTGKN